MPCWGLGCFLASVTLPCLVVRRFVGHQQGVLIKCLETIDKDEGRGMGQKRRQEIALRSYPCSFCCLSVLQFCGGTLWARSLDGIVAPFLASDVLPLIFRRLEDLLSDPTVSVYTPGREAGGQAAIESNTAYGETGVSPGDSCLQGCQQEYLKRCLEKIP